MTSAAEVLLRYTKDRAGKYFRGLAVYEDGDAELLATRDDLNEAEMDTRVTEIHEAIRTRAEFDAVETLGPPSSVIQVREKAVLVNLPVDDESGYLLGLEPEAARDLHAFVSVCQQIIRENDDGRTR